MRTIDKTELVEIIRKHKLWLAYEKGGERADLSSANLSSANLSSADLSSANLRYADLSYADLSYADLSSANLRYANLNYANLSSANLSSANLSSANLNYANLSSANLRYADLSYADLSYADLSSANLRYANLSSANLKDTILKDINWLAYIGIAPNKSGVAYAYKVTKADGQGIQYNGIDYASGKTFSVPECDQDVNRDCSFGINLATFSWALNAFTDKSYRLWMMKFNVKDAVCPIGSDGKFRVLKCTKVGECDWTGNLKKGEVK